MAVLHALLGHHPVARAKDGAAVASCSATTPSCRTRRSCGWPSTSSTPTASSPASSAATSTRSRRSHPDAPLPAVHRSDRLLEDAERLRDRDGRRRVPGRTQPDRRRRRTAVAGTRGPRCWAAPGPRRPTTRPAPRLPATSSAPQLVERSGQDVLQRLHPQHRVRQPRRGARRHQRARQEPRLRRRRDVPRRARAVARVQGPRPAVLRPRGAEGHQARRVRRGARAIPLISFVARQLDLRRYFVESGAAPAPTRRRSTTPSATRRAASAPSPSATTTCPTSPRSGSWRRCLTRPSATHRRGVRRAGPTPGPLGRAARRGPHREGGGARTAPSSAVPIRSRRRWCPRCAPWPPRCNATAPR